MRVSAHTAAPSSVDDREFAGSPVSACKILVADDNSDFANSIIALLEQHGRPAVAAGTVRMAVDILDEDPGIGLVLADIRMPDISGIDLLRVLRHRFPTLPVILMTGFPVEDEDLPPHHVEVLRKPFPISDLLRVIADRLQT